MGALRLAAALLALLALAGAKRRNVLLFICDDLRPQLNVAYGQDYMVTPNFDRFAKEALVFDHAYTNFAICSASRNSFMSGRQPDNTRTWNFIDDFRKSGVSDNGRVGADWVTMPQYFKDAGYLTYGAGKLYHPGHPKNWDEPNSWSQGFNYSYIGPTNSGCKGQMFCPEDVPDTWISDTNLTNKWLDFFQGKIVPSMKANTSQNFFLGLGFHFPHASHFTPAWAVDLYPGAGELPAPTHPYSPKGTPPLAFTAEFDGQPSLTLDEDNPILKKMRPAGVSGSHSYVLPTPGNNTFPPWFTEQIRLGYYSAVSHSDRLFGRVLDALETSGLADDTLVVVTGDHGWQLGEHTEYGKHTNYDLAVHVPLMMRCPWKPTSQGKHTTSFVELLDLYRTLADVAGVGLQNLQDDVDGSSAAALLDDPTNDLKEVAFAQYSRCPGDRYWPHVIPGAAPWVMNNCEEVPARNISFMGYTIRTKEFRYTEWLPMNKEICAADWNNTVGVELYDHRTDPSFPVNFNDFENENVAGDPAFKATISALAEQLRARFVPRVPRSCPSGSPTPSPFIEHMALVTQYSPVHKDHCLCGTEKCLTDKGAQYNYTKVGVEGYMPGEGTTGTVTLYSLYSSKVTDNLVTTDDRAPDGYVQPADLNPNGFVFKAKPYALADTATVALQLWLKDGDSPDHVTTANPALIAQLQASGYKLLDKAIGYIYTSPRPGPAALELY